MADGLLDDLNSLKGWPERVRTMQANWIGRSTGATLRFPLAANASEAVEVFTTRPDTVYGVSYLVLAPEHGLVDQLTTDAQRPAVEQFRQELEAISDQDRVAEDRPKRGVATGGTAVHPFSGETIPVWIADYVLPDYGTGAVMGVPAHDSRDFAFACRYGLPITTVVIKPGTTAADAPAGEAFTELGELIHSGPFDGLRAEAAKQAVIDAAAAAGVGEAKVSYRLRDWLISRQRYWGCPIPVIHCDDCGAVPVPEEQLPVELPADAELGASGGSPLERHPTWSMVACPRCGKPTPWTPSCAPAGTTCATPTRPTASSPSALRPPRPGCRLTSTSVAWSTPSCTCSIHAFSPRCCTSAAWWNAVNPSLVS